MWCRDFISNGGEFGEYERGRYERYVITDNEEYKEMALAWVRSHSSIKGRPNMTAANFHFWVNSTLLTQREMAKHAQATREPSSTAKKRCFHGCSEMLIKRKEKWEDCKTILRINQGPRKTNGGLHASATLSVREMRHEELAVTSLVLAWPEDIVVADLCSFPRIFTQPAPFSPASMLVFHYQCLNSDMQFNTITSCF